MKKKQFARANATSNIQQFARKSYTENNEKFTVLRVQQSDFSGWIFLQKSRNREGVEPIPIVRPLWGRRFLERARRAIAETPTTGRGGE